MSPDRSRPFPAVQAASAEAPPAQAPIPVERRTRLAAPTRKPAFDGIYSWVGAAAAILGTLFAVTVTPDNAAKQGMLVLPSLGMAIALLIAPGLSVLTNIRNMLRTENIIGIAPVYWMFLDLLQGNYDLLGIGKPEIQMSYFAVGIFCTMFWIGTTGRALKLPAKLNALGKQVIPTPLLITIGTMMFVLGMCAFAIPSRFDISYMFYALTLDRWSAPWSRGQLGGWDAFIDHLAYFGYLLPPVTVMIAQRRGWLHPVTIVMVLFSMTFLLFLSHSGSRRIVGTCLGAAIVCWLLGQKRIKIIHIGLSMLLVAAVLWLMQLMLVARLQGYQNIGALSEYVTASLTKKIETRDSNLQVEDNFYRLAQTIQVIPNYHPYVNFNYVFYVAVRPIPRAIWRNKPVDGGFSIHDLVDQGASLSVSIIGELYMSYGYLAVGLGGWLIGKLSRLNAPFFTGSSQTFSIALYGYMTMWLMVGYRSMAELILFSYPVLGLMVLAAFFRKKT